MAKGLIPFHEAIREARKALGFQTAKEFHRVKTKEISSEFSMSYESYSNIEAGKYLPPADKLMGIVMALEIQDLKAFLFSYCATLMPNDLFKGFFSLDDQTRVPTTILKSDAFPNYKEKFEALMQLNQMQAKCELSQEQIDYLEKDIVGWDVFNLFISTADDGLYALEIAKKTNSDLPTTLERIQNLVRLGILKELSDGKYIVVQDAFVIPRKPNALGLTHKLVKRELEKCYADPRNKPYTRFRLMSIDPADYNKIEMMIDNFMLDIRKYKRSDGKTHYMQVLFSDRQDLL